MNNGKSKSLSLLLPMPLLLLGAPSCDPTEADPEVCEFERYVEDRSRELIDLLFVVDTSPSMIELEAQMQQNVMRFANVIENIEGGVPDIRIAVVSADLGAGGHEVLGCTGDGQGGRFISSAGGPGCPDAGARFIEQPIEPWFTCGNPMHRSCLADANYPGELADALACLMPPVSTCEVAQPLEAMKRALDHSNPENADFLREGAFLAVIFIGDDDDCSAAAELFDPADSTYGPIDTFRCVRAGVECAGQPLDGSPGSYSECAPRADEQGPLVPVDYYRDFLRGLKDDPATVLISAAAGNGSDSDDTLTVIDDGQPGLSPACVNGTVSALPAPRIQTFARSFEYRHALTSTCEEDHANTLVLVTELYKRVLGLPCYSEVSDEDIDPVAPGLQLACTVVDRSYSIPASESDVPRCVMDSDQVVASDTPLPCWWAYDDESGFDACRLRIHVERAYSAGNPLKTAFLQCPQVEAICEEVPPE